MGVRLYSPGLGRFLQTDPIPGGSSNAYDYAGQGPINRFDLDGRWGWHKFTHWVSHHKLDIALVALSFVPVAGEVAWGYRGARLAEGGLGFAERGAVGGAITGYIRHGLERAMLRDGHGVSPRAILDAVRSPQRAWSDVASRTSTYVGRNARVILNSRGRLITTYARNRGGWRYGE